MTSSYILKSKKIYTLFIDFIEEEENTTNIYILIDYFRNQKIEQNKYELKEFLVLISKISKNHHRNSNFIYKIQQIILLFVNDIKQTFSNNEIIKIFKNNKIILYFLLKNQIVIFDESNFKMISKHEKYFQKTIEKNDEENLSIGENDSYISKLIREDSIEEFIIYVNKTNFPLKTAKINSSIYETNSFLINKNPTLIEYASFFGSIQIFIYLQLNNVELTSSLWLYSIHSNNPEMIHLLERNFVEPDDKTYKKCLEEAIKCHHNKIANYIKDNLLINDNEKLINGNKFYYSSLSACCFHYHNYDFFFIENFDVKYSFFYLCQYDYYNLVDLILKTQEININEKMIHIYNDF